MPEAPPPATGKSGRDGRARQFQVEGHFWRAPAFRPPAQAPARPRSGFNNELGLGVRFWHDHRVPRHPMVPLARGVYSARVRRATGSRKSIGAGMQGSRFAGLCAWTVVTTANAVAGLDRGIRCDRGGSRQRCCCLSGSYSCGAHVLISYGGSSAYRSAPPGCRVSSP
jgi:hypothetical protein